MRHSKHAPTPLSLLPFNQTPDLTAQLLQRAHNLAHLLLGKGRGRSRVDVQSGGGEEGRFEVGDDPVGASFGFPGRGEGRTEQLPGGGDGVEETFASPGRGVGGGCGGLARDSKGWCGVEAHHFQLALFGPGSSLSIPLTVDGVAPFASLSLWYSTRSSNVVGSSGLMSSYVIFTFFLFFHSGRVDAILQSKGGRELGVLGVDWSRILAYTCHVPSKLLYAIQPLG